MRELFCALGLHYGPDQRVWANKRVECLSCDGPAPDTNGIVI